MGLNRSDRFRIRLMEFCANGVELLYYPLLYKKYDGLEKKENVRYDGSVRRAALDVYRKKDGNPSVKKPLLFYIHGGGWVSGWRAIRRYYCKHWAEEGYVAVNVGYDYARGETHRDFLRQIFAALEFVLDRADEWGFDKTRVIVGGESAGGHLAAMIGAMTTHRELFDELGVDFSYKDTFKPSALLLLSGIYDPYRSIDTGFPFIKTYVSAFAGETYRKLKAHFDGDERRLTSPEVYADEAFPPSFVVASSADKLLSESLSLYTKLRSSGVPCAYFVCKGINGMHAASLDSVHGKYGKECFARAVAFMREALAKVFADGANAA